MQKNKKTNTRNYLNAIFVHKVFSTINTICQTDHLLTKDGALQPHKSNKVKDKITCEALEKKHLRKNTATEGGADSEVYTTPTNC